MWNRVLNPTGSNSRVGFRPDGCDLRVGLAANKMESKTDDTLMQLKSLVADAPDPEDETGGDGPDREPLSQVLRRLAREVTAHSRRHHFCPLEIACDRLCDPADRVFRDFFYEHEVCGHPLLTSPQHVVNRRRCNVTDSN